MFFFFFNDPATTEISPLPLPDALPISPIRPVRSAASIKQSASSSPPLEDRQRDRKSTRLNSSHSQISYAVFCLKKKIKKYSDQERRKSLEFLITSVYSSVIHCSFAITY